MKSQGYIIIPLRIQKGFGPIVDGKDFTWTVMQQMAWKQKDRASTLWNINTLMVDGMVYGRLLHIISDGSIYLFFYPAQIL